MEPGFVTETLRTRNINVIKNFISVTPHKGYYSIHIKIMVFKRRRMGKCILLYAACQFAASFVRAKQSCT